MIILQSQEYKELNLDIFEKIGRKSKALKENKAKSILRRVHKNIWERDLS